MRNAILGITLIFLLLPKACFFTDTEIYKVDPVADDPPLVLVVSNLDTLFEPHIGDSLKVSYELEIVNGEFYFMDAVISDETVHSSYSILDSFWIYPSQSTGLDSLYLDFYHSSNTNTLADKTGYEAHITSLRYAIDFDGELKK